jgi:hypothetical protein
LQALRQTARSESPSPSEKNATRRVLASLPTPPSIYAAPGHYMAATVAFLEEEQQLTVPNEQLSENLNGSTGRSYAFLSPSDAALDAREPVNDSRSQLQEWFEESQVNDEASGRLKQKRSATRGRELACAVDGL